MAVAGESQWPLLSVIVPVYNGGAAFTACLEALNRSTFRDWELIVVDDGSSDGSADRARGAGGTVLTTDGRVGPAAARNLGAQYARGTYVCFVDADCAVHPDTLGLFAATFAADPDLDAVFGSYDDRPAARNFVAQYKNLVHHYVHQTGHTDATTFWAGCGALRRAPFLAAGGFDHRRYRHPAIEDIELGHRLVAMGRRIQLNKRIFVTHHKAWTLANLITTDLFDRAIPWTALMLRTKSMDNDLNLQPSQRLSAGLVWLIALFASLAGVWRRTRYAAVAVILALVTLGLNRELYGFFLRQRGLRFAFAAVPLHWLYFMYSSLGLLGGMAAWWWEQQHAALPPPEPLVSRIPIEDRPSTGAGWQPA